MFERFTDHARRVLVLAQEDARRLGHPTIGDELLLLGLAHQQDTVAGQVLGEVGATADRLLERIPEARGRDRKKHGFGHISFTPFAKLVLEESLGLGGREIRTEHLLIALTRVDGRGVEVLRELEVDVEELRNRAAQAADGADEQIEETQATPWSTPKADVEVQLAGIESTLRQILDRLIAIESKLPEK
jgi:ATP-dependent Clp protease ATP-binding subunit ClpC